MKPLLGFLSTFLTWPCEWGFTLASPSSWPQDDPFRSAFLAVQQVLLRNYGRVIGGLEVAALFSTLALAIVTWGQPVVPFLATLASGCVLLMVIIWAALINPINKTVNSWTPESLPSNWAKFRDRWHFLHTIRLVLSLVAFSAAIGGLLA